MTYASLVHKAHERIAAVIKPGDLAIDATVGNGHDTLFLAETVGVTGHVLGFDVQHAAIENTLKRLAEKNLHQRVSLLQQSHASLGDHLNLDNQQHLRAVMFNLGYLPGSDKTVVTQVKSTLAALNSVLPMLAAGGVITIMVYPGHPGGAEEAQAVLAWSTDLNAEQYRVDIVKSPTPSTTAPQLIIISVLS